MKLNYFELLSPEPIQVENVGGIISPTLHNIASIGYSTYQIYLSILLMDSKNILAMKEESEKDGLLAEEEQQNSFETFVSIPQFRDTLQKMLNFFIKEEVIYSPPSNSFIVQNEAGELVGTVTKNNFSTVSNMICQRNSINTRQNEDLSKVKSKKALAIMEKLNKGRAEKNKQNKADKNMELGNIISAVANKSQSLNILNIWDLTIFQLWDCFARLNNNTLYDIQSISVATWGNKDNYFDSAAWFKKIEIDK